MAERLADCESKLESLTTWINQQLKPGIRSLKEAMQAQIGELREELETERQLRANLEKELASRPTSAQVQSLIEKAVDAAIKALPVPSPAPSPAQPAITHPASRFSSPQQQQQQQPAASKPQASPAAPKPQAPPAAAKPDDDDDDFWDSKPAPQPLKPALSRPAAGPSLAKPTFSKPPVSFVPAPAAQPKPSPAPPAAPIEIEADLQSAGLGRLVPNFVAQGVTTVGQLRTLQESRFRDLGVVTPAHRRSLSTLIATLQPEPEPEPEPEPQAPAASEVDALLKSAGLERYANAFRTHGVASRRQLADVEPQQYKSFGVILPAHVKLLATLVLSLQADAEMEDEDDFHTPPPSVIKTQASPAQQRRQQPVSFQSTFKPNTSSSSSSSSAGRSNDLFGGSSGARPRPQSAYVSSATAASLFDAAPSSGGHSSEDVAAVVRDLRSDSTDIDWLLLELKSGAAAPTFQACGAGGYDAFIEHISDSKIQYALLRLIQGDQESRRVKFVFVRWVGSSCSAILKAKANTMKSGVVAQLGQFHVEIFAEDESELRLERITEKLKAAAGADYDQGNKGGYASSAGSLKAQALDRYRNKEKESTLGRIVYETSALPSTTPCDISNRPFVAPSSEARSNIRGYN